MPQFSIAVLPGDGIGPEVTAEALRVLRAVEAKLDGIGFDLAEYPAGAAEYLRSGNPLPGSTMQACRTADAILLGAMGLPDVRRPGGTEMAPQLDIREQLDLYAGIRPIRLYHPAHSPLRPERAAGTDFIIYRENTEGMFASRNNGWQRDATEVCDTMRISRRGSERLFRAAFRHAERRRRLVTLVDKSNVLPSMAFFRSIFDEVSREFPEVRTERIYIDASTLYLVQRPNTFDIVVTENIFGDILSDLAAGLVGGMGLAPSADVGDRHAVFQPSHGSAPDIAGKGIANPLATILSAAMMLEWFDHPHTKRGASMIHRAVEAVCADPTATTPDLGGRLSTAEIGQRVVDAL